MQKRLSCDINVSNWKEDFVNQTNVLHEETNALQTGITIARRVIRVSEFVIVRDAGLTMFGTWKGTDHCDKDIRK